VGRHLLTVGSIAVIKCEDYLVAVAKLPTET
jgi:hypothetical protein